MRGRTGTGGECAWVRARMPDAIDEALPDGERLVLERHLSVCAACRDELDGVRAVVRALRRLPHERAPADFLARLRPRLQQQGGRPHRRLRWAPPVAVAAAAALAVAAVALWRAPGQPEGGEPRLRQAAAPAGAPQGESSAFVLARAGSQAPSAPPAPAVPSPSGEAPRQASPVPAPVPPALRGDARDAVVQAPPAGAEPGAGRPPVASAPAGTPRAEAEGGGTATAHAPAAAPAAAGAAQLAPAAAVAEERGAAGAALAQARERHREAAARARAPATATPPALPAEDAAAGASGAAQPDGALLGAAQELAAPPRPAAAPLAHAAAPVPLQGTPGAAPAVLSLRLLVAEATAARAEVERLLSARGALVFTLLESEASEAGAAPLVALVPARSLPPLLQELAAGRHWQLLGQPPAAPDGERVLVLIELVSPAQK
ncbi:MAG: hypothetical protein KatS3mg102_0481 [Planctomycetota bacterium]|nr:MAG: hypothetical protein KatS3mg102_0481 [Planctomycetota bacterium]